MYNINTEFEKFAKGQGMGITSAVLSDYSSHINSQLKNPIGMTPNIIEERQLNISVLDVFSRLMMDRVIFLGTGVNDQVANIITAQLLFLESVDGEKDITMYINSPGGGVYAGLGIYDTMQYIKPDVGTVCTGLAASMGAVLLAGGAEGKRSALKHSRVMIHQPLGGAQGQASDMEITVKQIQLLKTELYDILSHHSGKTMDEITKDADRDYWMIAEEAREYGLIDTVLKRK